MALGPPRPQSLSGRPGLPFADLPVAPADLSAELQGVRVESGAAGADSGDVPVSELAGQLLPKLYESWLKAALEAQAHVEANWGPSIVEVKFSRRDPQQPVTWGLKLLKEWREREEG